MNVTLVTVFEGVSERESDDPTAAAVTLSRADAIELPALSRPACPWLDETWTELSTTSSWLAVTVATLVTVALRLSVR